MILEHYHKAFFHTAFKFKRVVGGLAWKFDESRNLRFPVSYRKHLCRDDKTRERRCHISADSEPFPLFSLLFSSVSFAFFFFRITLTSPTSALLRCRTQPSNKYLKYGTNNDLIKHDHISAQAISRWKRTKKSKNYLFRIQLNLHKLIITAGLAHFNKLSSSNIPYLYHVGIRKKNIYNNNLSWIINLLRFYCIRETIRWIKLVITI